MQIIKKYGNRRLYSMKLRKYIGYREVFQMVRSRIPFKVLDHDTRKDVTLRVVTDLLARHPRLRGNTIHKRVLDLIRAL